MCVLAQQTQARQQVELACLAFLVGAALAFCSGFLLWLWLFALALIGGKDGVDEARYVKNKQTNKQTNTEHKQTNIHTKTNSRCEKQTTLPSPCLQQLLKQLMPCAWVFSDDDQGQNQRTPSGSRFVLFGGRTLSWMDGCWKSGRG